VNIAAERQALAASLNAITDFQVSPYLLSNPSPPYVMIHADETEYDETIDGGTHNLSFGVRVVVPFTGDVGAQHSLDEYRAGARSIKDALEAGRSDLRVVSAGPDTFYGEGGIGFEARVLVLAED
jgi:hypothetical protein